VVNEALGVKARIHPDHKDPRAGLRDEMARINNERSKLHTEGHQGFCQSREVATVKEPLDVLDRNNPG
jgi:hypothetical protein